MSVRKKIGIVATLAFCALLPLLMAPTGGIPSRLRVQALGINQAPGAAGTINGIQVSDFARQSQPNTFTADQTVSSTTPTWFLNETDAAADNRLWRITARSEQFLLGTRNDANNAGSNFLSVQRTGTSVNSVELSAQQITLNGAASINLQAPAVQVNGIQVSDFARQSQPNTFTADQTVSSTAPTWFLNETDAAADNRLWRIAARSEEFLLGTRNDANNAGSNFLSVQRTGTSVNSVELSAQQITLNGAASINLQAPAVQVNGASVVAQVSGTFTGQFSAMCTTTPSGTFRYSKVGNIVTLMMESSVTCTSDSTTTALDNGALPAAIRPSSDRCTQLIVGTNNGTTEGPVSVRVEADGGMNFAFGATNCSGTNWTSSGTKTLPPFNITYTVQ